MQEPRLQNLYGWIEDFISTQGFSPTCREIKSALEYNSTSTVQRDLEVLRARGQLVWAENKSRTIRPVTLGEVCQSS